MVEIDGGDEPQPANEGITIPAIQARVEQPFDPESTPKAEATGWRRFSSIGT